MPSKPTCHTEISLMPRPPSCPSSSPMEEFSFSFQSVVQRERERELGNRVAIVLSVLRSCNGIQEG